MSTNPKVDSFIGRQKQWKVEMEIMRDIVLSCNLTEELKWGKPCYSAEKNNIVIIQGFKEYCALMFFKGSLLSDPNNILIQPTKNMQAQRQIRFTKIEEIKELEPVIKQYIGEAVENEKAGLKVEFKKTNEFEVVVEFQEKLDNDLKLKNAFERLTPGRQRAYLLHFSGAKQSKTRLSRVEKCIPLILEGKGLND